MSPTSPFKAGNATGAGSRSAALRVSMTLLAFSESSMNMKIPAVHLRFANILPKLRFSGNRDSIGGVVEMLRWGCAFQSRIRIYELTTWNDRRNLDKASIHSLGAFDEIFPFLYACCDRYIRASVRGCARYGGTEIRLHGGCFRVLRRCHSECHAGRSVSSAEDQKHIACMSGPIPAGTRFEANGSRHASNRQAPGVLAGLMRARRLTQARACRNLMRRGGIVSRSQE